MEENFFSNDQMNNEPEKQVEYPATKLSAFCFEWSETLVQAFIIVVLLLTFLFRGFTVDGESMMNTLHNGDKVAVVRWKYVPKDGDVVVIRKGAEIDKPIIKRIIATEGQSLKINYSDGSVIVDGKKLDETYIREPMIRLISNDAKIPAIVPEGYCFVMGDNRNHSSDSRCTAIGLIPYSNIIGKAKFVFYPFDRAKVIE